MKNPNPIITFIVPVYKVPDNILSFCIKSVINQTVKDWELILVDDESPDNAGMVCDFFVELDSRISVIHQKNQGVSVARNEGIKQAKGEWICFVDSDDWLEENYISEFMEMHKEVPDADILISACYVNYDRKQVKNPFFTDSKLIGYKEGKDRFILEYLCGNIHGDNLSPTDVGSPWAKIYRTDFLKKEKLLFNRELRRMQDNVFNLYAFELANKIYYSEKYLYHYRKSEFSGFARYIPKIVDYYELFFFELSLFISRYNKGEFFKDALYVKIIKSFYAYCKMNFTHKDNSFSLKERILAFNKLITKDIYQNAIKRVKPAYFSRIEYIFFILLKYKLTYGIFGAMKAKDLYYKLSGKGL